MTDIQIFNNPEFGTVRALDDNGSVLFASTDVAQSLGYAKPQDAVARHCRYSVKRGVPHPQAPDKTIEMSFIPESDLYRLVFSSKLPTAEKFTDWVTSEVLPSIRKHGAYMTPQTLQAAILNPDTMIQLCQQLKAEQDKNAQLHNANRQLLAESSDLKPDAEYARTVCIGDNCRTATSIAKDYGMSAEKLNSILHGLKIQWKNSDGQWVLYAKHCGKGYTKNRKGRPFEHNSGKVQTPNTTVWTEAGQRFIYEQLKAIGMVPHIDHPAEQTTFDRAAGKQVK